MPLILPMPACLVALPRPVRFPSDVETLYPRVFAIPGVAASCAVVGSIWCAIR